MSRQSSIVAAVAFVCVANVRSAEALCTPRQSFELVVTNKVSPDASPDNLRDGRGNLLGCAISRDKSSADLCAPANGTAIPFTIAVRNECQHPIGAVIRVTKRLTGRPPIDFKPGIRCDEATASGRPVDLPPGRSDDVTCRSLEYAALPGSADVFTGTFAIDVRTVNGTQTRNGLFDPQIAVERDGDVSTSFPWWAPVFGGLVTLGLGALVGWFVRKWLSGAPGAA